MILRYMLLAIALAIPVTVAAAEPIPDIIYGPKGAVTWVSASRAIDDRGALRAELLGRHSPRLRKNAEQNGATCSRFIGSHPGHFKPTSSLSDLATNAATIVSGRVAAAEQGFLHGAPGTLLRLVGTQLKGRAVREVYLFYPHARIVTADGTICSKPVANEYTPPQTGDRLVVFSIPDTIATGDRMIVHVDVVRELLHESRAGKLHVPPALHSRGARAETFDEIEQRVTRCVRDAVAAQ